MIAASNTVLKKDAVRVSGTRAIPLPSSSGPAAPQPAATVVRSGEGSTVVKIVCSCGKTLHLCCTHPSLGTPSTGTEPPRSKP